VSVPGPFGGFGFDPSDIGRMLGGDGPISWELAKMMARQGTGSEPNVDPLQRMRLDELLRVADLHVAETTGLATSQTGRPLTADAVSQARWAERTLDDYKPLLERLAVALAPPAVDGDAPPDLPPGAEALGPLFAQLPKVLGPMMMGFQTGMLVAQLSQRAFGAYELPVPRPPTDAILLLPSAIDRFAGAWSLPVDDVSLWVCIDQVAHHAVLGVPHVRSTLTSLLLEHAGGFTASGVDVDERLGAIDPSDPAALQSFLSDPEAVLDAVRTPAQDAMRPRLEAVVTVIEGYVDHVLDTLGRRLVGSYGALSEALRRARIEASPSDHFVDHFLGLELGERQYDRGRAFVHGVLERAGDDALTRLWTDEHTIPTPAEVDAPGLWLARIDL
jgi:putative hydrolase